MSNDTQYGPEAKAAGRYYVTLGVLSPVMPACSWEVADAALRNLPSRRKSGGRYSHMDAGISDAQMQAQRQA
jgi:hypothetical protein